MDEMFGTYCINHKEYIFLLIAFLVGQNLHHLASNSQLNQALPNSAENEFGYQRNCLLCFSATRLHIVRKKNKVVMIRNNILGKINPCNIVIFRELLFTECEMPSINNFFLLIPHCNTNQYGQLCNCWCFDMFNYPMGLCAKTFCTDIMYMWVQFIRKIVRGEETPFLDCITKIKL